MTSQTELSELQQLADLIQYRNELEKKISAMIGQPAAVGPLGEYIASRLFPIHLMKNATHPSIDGYFYKGPLAPCSVNIKWITVREGLLDITPGFLPDYYLVLAGPPPTLTSQLQIRSRPWKIRSVHLFDANQLVDNLESRGVRVGPASSIRKELWDASEIFPKTSNPLYEITAEQFALLELYK
jgi:hypothetical protein